MAYRPQSYNELYPPTLRYLSSDSAGHECDVDKVVDVGCKLCSELRQICLINCKWTALTQQKNV